MNELLELLGPELTPIIQNLLLTLVGVLSTYLGIQFKKLMSKAERSKEVQEIRNKLKANEELVKLSVEYVEKIGGHLASDEKRDLAIEKTVEIANQKGLDITRTEIEVMIEGILLNFKEGYNSKDGQGLVNHVGKRVLGQHVVESLDDNHSSVYVKEDYEDNETVHPEEEIDNEL